MMLTPCWPSAGPTGGAGLACPPGIWSLISVSTFLAISVPLVELFHVVESDLDRHLPLEDVDHHLKLLGVGVHVGDLAVEVGQRAGRDLHRLAERELHLSAGRRDAAGAGVEDPVDLRLRERDRLRAGADEARHAGGVLHHGPGVVVQVHVHEHVAGEDALLGLHLLAVLRLDHLLGRDDDAPEARALPHRLDPVLEVGLHLVLVARIGVDDVPAEHGYFRRIFWTTFFQISSLMYRNVPTMMQATITTTVPWMTWFCVGHSTFCSSAHDSWTKPKAPPRRCTSLMGRSGR